MMFVFACFYTLFCADLESAFNVLENILELIYKTDHLPILSTHRLYVSRLDMDRFFYLIHRVKWSVSVSVSMTDS